MGNRRDLGLERFKAYVKMVCDVNESMERGKLSISSARRIIEEKGKDSAGRIFAECDEVSDEGRTRFEVKKKYVMRYMIR